ncbi:T9SS type A sorting domain-containing protein [Owenweeksia hongkongensis]|uniref:Secretion system C-terminal sorting domain-containing protein n=1 Tax=Owenweeksia hongkongensis (strain DSM 17368 / CIP 108786 / JCM 12287 / NRRL B-23963 / UST20020801) TaxID=926562 RepID=G8R2A4_OWEHD|nr:T9SS type A sorting domain-containing protein [Owenweeksia hongkongensis]AEV32894.1 hypothetical protein Oweho_1915 [Owenweeksia hongkongensis DSM 17368]
MKLKLLSLLLCAGSMVMAQSLTIENVDSSHTSGDAVTADDLTIDINIRNNSSQAIEVGCKRIDKNYNALTDSNAICWVVCYKASVSVSPGTITIGAGQATGGGDVFIGHVYPDQDGVNRSGPITYVWYDVDNPSDSVAFTANYEVTGGIGIEEKSFDEFAVYPNPASGILNVKYTGMRGESASFELVSMVGTKVYSRELTEVDDQLKLDVSKLSRGVYFYIIKSNGEVTTSKKLVIK